MHRSRLALLAPGAVLALGLPVMALGLSSGSAGAAITDGCDFGQYPNAPGGQSQLQVNCTFTNADSSSNETIEDFPQAVWHDGAAWKLTDGVTTAGSATVTSASGHFNASTDINDTISGLGISADSFIIAVNSPTSVTLDNKATLSKTADALTIDNSDTRSVTNGATTNANTTITSGVRSVTNGVTTASSTTLTSATAAFTANDVGATVTDTASSRSLINGVTTANSTTITSATAAFTATDIGATVTDTSATHHIPAGDTIVSVTNGTTAVLATAATLAGTAEHWTIAQATHIPAGDTIASVTNGTTAVLAIAATLSGTADHLTFADTLGVANFTSADVGGIVTGTNIPAYDTIASVTSPNTAVLTTKATATGTAQTLTIDANHQVSTTREVTDAQVTSGSTTLTSASANFQASDVQLPVTGCGIPTGTYIASVTDASDVVLSNAATLTRPFAVSDGATTTSSPTVTSATAGFSTACDADKAISGAGIPAGAYIKTVTNATTVTISANATATATGVSLTESPGVTAVIGAPSPTAPANDDAVSTIGSTLTLNPTLVKGAAPCAAGEPSGETIEGGWYNPGSYLANTLALAPADLPTDTVGEILYPTSVVSFAGYVVNEGASTPGELDTAAHTDIILPFVPTGLALCATPALGIGSSFSFNGSTITQQKVATGVGTPGTADVRGIENLGSGVSTTTGTAYLINGKGSSPYSGGCTTNFPAAVSDVPCS